MSLDTTSIAEDDTSSASVLSMLSTEMPSYTYNVTSLGPSVGQDDCVISTKYGIYTSIVAVVCFLFGVLYTFFGYRFFKAIMFLTGFLFGTVLVYMLLAHMGLLPPEGCLGAGGGAGVMLGLLTMLLPQAGLFLTGFNLGVAVSGLGLVLVEALVVQLQTKWISMSVLIASGVLLGLLGLRFQKAVTVVSTGVMGAALALAGVDYFVELGQMAKFFWERVIVVESQGLCWFSWVVLGSWPVLALLGGLMQWRFTAKDIDHTIALCRYREPGTSLQVTRAREQKEPQHTRYRHLYQARRVKGDVISQNYIQSIQHKLSPQMQSLTALNIEQDGEESNATTTLTHDTSTLTQLT